MNNVREDSKYFLKYPNATPWFTLRYDNFLARIYWSIRFRRILSLIKKYKKNGKLLDVGCAYGFFASFTSKRNFDVTGCDISEHAVNKAKKCFPNLKIFKKDIQNKTKFKNNFFDVVTAFDVLEHCKNLTPVLREIKRILKPDGIFFISVPATDFVSLKKDKDYTHVRHFSLSDWMSVLKRNRFSVLETIIPSNILNKITLGVDDIYILLKKY